MDRSVALERAKYRKFVWWRVAAFCLRNGLHSKCRCVHVRRTVQLLGRETALERRQGPSFSSAPDQVHRRRRARLVRLGLFVWLYLLPVRNSGCIWRRDGPVLGPRRHQHFPRRLRTHWKFTFPRRIARLPCSRIRYRGRSQATPPLRVPVHDQNARRL